MAQLGCRVLPKPDDPVEVPHIMRALEPEVFDAVYAAVSPLLPAPPDGHPLGCHRRRVPDRTCLWAMLVRLTTGCSWVDAERLCGGVSDTTLRARRDEWVAARVFDILVETMLAIYDEVVGLDLAETCVDGSLHKAPCGGEGTGKSPVDRGKLGWKWSVATDADGIPLAWVSEAANRNDCVLLPATLEAVRQRGLLDAITTLHLDRGYDNGVVRAHVAAAGIAQLVVPPVRPRVSTRTRQPAVRVPLGRRWPVERTNSWLSNYGQLRRNTDRRQCHRDAQLAFVVAILLIVKLLDRATTGSD
ncbi:MAG TPA: IS5 family transposase [Acidimicrobiales bacterium]|nr:IS5 family transposase [Acidimicrobiales bacterium]